MIEELKKKYPLAVDALKGRKMVCIPNSYLSTNVKSIDRMVQIKTTTSTEIDPTEKAQHQIGEMLADLLNQIAKP